ncbi:MAG: PAS domain-containing protein [Gammaproteobacteria bacterium]|nr:PAS domain-containing protein [Gammaproteobacteria bacterium]
MEHRGRSQRFPVPEPGLAARTPGTDLLRRDTPDGGRHELPAAGRLPRRSQPPGRSAGRDGRDDDSLPSESLLRATEQRSLGNDDSGDGPLHGNSRRILDSLSAGVILLDEHLLIVDLNPAAENILGISWQRARGKSLLQLVDDEPEMREILSRVAVTGDHYANEIRLAPTEVHSEERTIDCHVSPVAIDDARLLVEVTDVTRRMQISRENALLIQHGAGRQMIRQLAHEIKNPLGGIRGAAQLLERQLEGAELREYTDVVISETDRLAALVDTLLGPGGPPNKQPVNVHELLEYVVRIIEAEDDRRLTIHRDYDPGLPLIDLDRDQMVQAFLNLMRNAAAALDGQGTITLRSRAVTNFTIGNVRHRVIASLEIEDDGPGIPTDMQDSVFYPLVTSRPDGTGLGLPAAQELISRHGGLIEFDSRPGRTVFMMRIPLKQVNNVG